VVSRHLIKSDEINSDELAPADPAAVVGLPRPAMVALAAQSPARGQRGPRPGC
jgi:hypothetical protein